MATLWITGPSALDSSASSGGNDGPVAIPIAADEPIVQPAAVEDGESTEQSTTDASTEQSTTEASKEQSTTEASGTVCNNTVVMCKYIFIGVYNTMQQWLGKGKIRPVVMY